MPRLFLVSRACVANIVAVARYDVPMCRYFYARLRCRVRSGSLRVDLLVASFLVAPKYDPI